MTPVPTKVPSSVKRPARETVIPTLISSQSYAPSAGFDVSTPRSVWGGESKAGGGWNCV